MTPVTRFDKSDIYAVKAVNSGVASEAQQKRAIAFILERLCLLKTPSYVPGDRPAERETLIRQGRKAVGYMLADIITGVIAEDLTPEKEPKNAERRRRNQKP